MRWKAMLSSVALLGLLGVWTTPAIAEVQNVKVGGDVTVRSFYRKCLDLNCTNSGGVLDARDAFLMSTTGLNVAADLTENVSAFLRLANERDWNVAVASSSVNDIALSQSYITLKELLYAPLTLRLGRQPIVWGRGFVLGSNLLPGVINGANDIHAAITANEFTDFTAFDAIRATLDLSNVGGLNLPLVADMVYVKLNENNTGLSDDVNLLGVNLGTHFDAGKSEVETYFLNKRDKGARLTAGNNKNGSVSTLGIRGSTQPAEGAYLFGELAYQFGRRGVDSDGILISGDAQQAWASDLGIEYTFTHVATTPKLGWEWIFWSGKDVDGAAGGWDPIARGYFTTALREFQTGTNASFYPTTQPGDTAAATNQHQLAWYGSLKPIEDLVLAPRLTFFFLDAGSTRGHENKRASYAGLEWDTQLTYNYTPDVQFGVIYAVFKPGDVYRVPNNDTAQELVTSVSVKF